MDKKIKIGIIGTGTISHEHIKSYKKNPNVELYAFCDIDEKKLAEMAKKYGIENTFTDYNEMLSMPELDAVSVCVWNSEHAPCTIAALNAGKNVLCEKPMSISTQNAIAMKEAAEKNNKLLMIGFVRRFGNDAAVLKDFIEKDELGEIYYTKATYLRRNGAPGGWFGNKELSGGGPLIDLGVHVIDLVRYLMGNPKPVSVYGLTFQKLSDRKNIKGSQGYCSSGKGKTDIFNVEDLATAIIKFDNGAALTIEASFSLNIKKDTGTIELFGVKGGAKLSPELEIYTEVNDYLVNLNFDTETSLAFNGLFENEINHFVDCVKDGIPCKAPAEDGVEIMKILDGIYKSAQIGQEVIL
jgi:predicted dehydrogenase